MNRKFINLFIFILLHSFISQAEEGGEHIHGSHVECGLPQSTADVIKCAVENNPQAKRAVMAAAQKKILPEKAGQWSNPELDMDQARGNNESSSTEIGLLQEIQWGGKRSSKMDSAQAQIHFSEAEQSDIQAHVFCETIKKLHRLRQMELEKSIIANTIQTLQKIVLQQSSRPSLPPEQQVTLSVYKMALADAKIKASESFDEERELEHFFHISTGHSLAELKSILPQAIEKWPTLARKSIVLNSPAIKKALAEKSLAHAELAEARAATWPSLRLGPIFKKEENSGQNTNLFGFKLVMDLPIFSFNGGDRALARSGVTRFEKNLELTRMEENHERTEQMKIYDSAVQSLLEAPAISVIEKDFARHQGLAAKGLIPGSLLIEFHRQRSELIRSRNSRELKAIEALYRIYKIDGALFSEKL